MCDGFSNKKKKSGWLPRLPIHHPGRKRLNIRKFTKKKANFDAFLVPVGQAESSTLPVRIFFAGVFFLLLSDRKRITVTFLIFFFFF
jgi:hypothetical protein